jgi:hypothetical protein
MRDTAISEANMEITMTLKTFLAVLPLAMSLVTSATAQERMKETSAPQRANEIVGREVAAPSWSSACTTDQGPSPCGEPMWAYGSPREIARYKSAF